MSFFIDLKNFQVKLGDKYFLSPLTFSSEKPEFVVLSAPSGSGKTKLFESLTIPNSSNEGIVQIHNSLATVPQSLDLVRQETALNNVAMAALSNVSSFRTLFSIPQNLLIQARKHLESLGLADVEKPVFQLSGGEQQRVAMARVMMSSAKIWLLDEPVSQLDDQSAFHCLQILKKYSRDHQIFIFCILHQKQFSKQIADRQLIWADGKWNHV